MRSTRIGLRIFLLVMALVAGVHGDSGPVAVVSGATPPGGQDLPQPGAWGTRAPLIEANSEMSVAELDGKIYVIAGYPSSRISVATVQVYDPVSNRWRLTTPLPAALNHTMPAAVDGKLYIIGGQPGNSSAGPFVDSVYEYDPAKATWTARAPMPTQRGGARRPSLTARFTWQAGVRLTGMSSPCTIRARTRGRGCRTRRHSAIT